MKDDAFQVIDAAIQPALAVFIPEEFGVRQAGAQHPFVARHDLLAAILRDHVGDQGKAVRHLASLGIAQGKILLMRAHGGLKNLRRHVHELVFNGASQDHRPFGQARHFGQQPLVRDHFQSMDEGCLLDAFENHRGAFVGVQNHMGSAQLVLIILEAPCLDLAIRQEAVPARMQTAGNPGKAERHHLAIETGQDGMQGTHPAGGNTRLPAHGFGPGQSGHRLRDDLGQHGGGLAAFALDHRHIDIAFGRGVNRQLLLAKPGLLQKAFDGGGGRIDLGPFQFLAHIALLRRQAGDRQRDPARP